MDSEIQETDVIVCGCGPTGAMLSVLLSQYSIPHVVLEKETQINKDPRGIALDEDGIRYLQACGIYDKIFSEIGQCESPPNSQPFWPRLTKARYGSLQFCWRCTQRSYQEAVYAYELQYCEQ